MAFFSALLRFFGKTPLFGVVLLLGAGLLGVGCSSSGATRTSPSAADQSGQMSQAGQGDPVKVLRLTQVQRRIESAAQEWYGTPYKWGGSSKEGVDCSAFVKNVYEDAFAYELPRVTETQVQVGVKVPRDQIRPGDLVFFHPENEYNHVGVYIGNGTFAHASSNDGVTKADMGTSYWTRYYWTARRPITTATVPDALATELLAYRYPGAGTDSTQQVTQTSDTTASQTAGDEGAQGAVATEGRIVSCEAANVDCATSAVGSGSTVAAADTTTRKGW